MASYILNTANMDTVTLAKDDTIGCNTAGAYHFNLPPGVYKLECWGAQGGSYSTSYAAGGRGGYAAGTITLTEETKIHAYVGGQGSANSASATELAGGGFNGGGKATYRGGGGGGGTDIRINKDDLYARVIVAGGGGGAFAYSTTIKASGGAGGGANGVNGGSSESGVTTYYGIAGSQTSGGASNTGVVDTSSYNGSAGTFGTGGNTGNSYGLSTFFTYNSGGAGGGGWYGGSAADNYISSTSGAGGGGGSGYVYTSSTASNYPSGCLLNSQYYLTDTSNINGITSFTDYDGTTKTGHTGNGAIKITVIEIIKTSCINKIFLKIATNTWIELFKESATIIGGNSILVNLVEKPIGSTGWLATNCNVVEDGGLIAILPKSSTVKYVQAYHYYTVTSGHIYYVRADVYHDTSTAVGYPAEINISSKDELQWFINAPATGYTGSSTQSFARVSNVGTINTDEIQLKLAAPTKSDGSTVFSGELMVGWNNIMLSDLTATFGAGNEPTKAWCDENILYFNGSTAAPAK